MLEPYGAVIGGLEKAGLKSARRSLRLVPGSMLWDLAGSEEFTPMRVPLLFNLRTDPYEEATITSNTYNDWMIDRIFLLVPAQAYVAQFLETFKEYPPSQPTGSTKVEVALQALQAGSAGGGQ